MDRRTALAVLGVTDETPPAAVRTRYLDLLRTVHPDVAGSPSRDTPPRPDAADVTEAYRVIRAAHPGTIETVDASAGDTLFIDLPPDEAFVVLVDAFSRVGQIAYIDRQNAIVESVVTTAPGVTCSIVATLQGRATGTTEAFCTIDAIGQGKPPPIDAVVAEIAVVLKSL